MIMPLDVLRSVDLKIRLRIAAGEKAGTASDNKLTVSQLGGVVSGCILNPYKVENAE